MKIIDKIGRRYPALDMESVRILLAVYENPGFCVREIADILGLDHKAVQLKIALMAAGRKNRNSKRLRLINTDYKVSDKRKRDLMLTDSGRDLAELLKSLNLKTKLEVV
ncbi:MAG: hypothetical protein PHV82_08150 [Victivallaceae bacterium]|nr:hypothetical protein [Victivallaceae bacterium]